MHSKRYQTILLFFFALLAVFSAIAFTQFFIREEFKSENRSGFFYGFAIDFEFVIWSVAISALYAPLADRTIKRLSLKSKKHFQVALNLATILSVIYLVGILIFKIIAETVVDLTLATSFLAVMIVFLLTFIFSSIFFSLKIIGTHRKQSTR